jgi:hypothetical protein
MLSSDILEQQFGPTRVKVLYHDEAYSERIIQTIAKTSGKILELSWVTFDPKGSEHFAAVHETVKRKTSIGKAFRQVDLELIRRLGSTNRIALPSSFTQYFNVDGEATVVEVEGVIEACGSEVRYCDILETYSPEVVWPETALSSTSPYLASRIGRFASLLNEQSK